MSRDLLNFISATRDSYIQKSSQIAGKAVCTSVEALRWMDVGANSISGPMAQQRPAMERYNRAERDSAYDH